MAMSPPLPPKPLHAPEQPYGSPRGAGAPGERWPWRPSARPPSGHFAGLARQGLLVAGLDRKLLELHLFPKWDSQLQDAVVIASRDVIEVETLPEADPLGELTEEHTARQEADIAGVVGKL